MNISLLKPGFGWLLLILLSSIGNAVLADSQSEQSRYGAAFEGTFSQGGLVVGTTHPGAIVMLDDQKIRVSQDGIFLLGFGRDAKAEWQLSIIYPDGRQFNNPLKVSTRNYDIQYIDGLPNRMVNPSAEDLKRIRADTKLVVNARRTDDARTNFLEGFDWPLVGIITGVYGSQRVINGEPRRPHYGIDIAAPEGTPVVAPAGGIVTMAHPDMYFSGGTLIIDHGHGLSSTFLHLQEILVSEGQSVEKGEVFATVGSTGRSTGPHLDWRINLFKARLDPVLLAGDIPTPSN